MESRINEHTSPDDSEKSPELRMVLFGGRELHGPLSLQSAAGNIILGQLVFETNIRTAQSEARTHEVHGRRVTVVNTPPWLWHYPRENTPLLDQMEIKNSVHLCPPGPHAFLLVIPLGMVFIPIYRQSLTEHLQLFHEGFFRHTLVLFMVETTCTYEYLEDEISSWPSLQWVLQQCGNRKHFLNINEQKDDTQVRTLLQKIEAMVENAGGIYNVDGAEGRALKEEMEAITARASKRYTDVQRHRGELRALIKGGKIPPRHLRLVMVGAQWSAKSSAGNTILRRQAFAVSHKKKTRSCEIAHGMVGNLQLTVVDSPGWLYNHTLKDTSELDKQEIESSMYLCPPGPHVVLLVVGLASAINTSYLKAVQEHVSLFTDDVWMHTMVVFTRGDWLASKTVEERIESEEGLLWLMEKCGNMYHVLDNTNLHDEAQVTELLEKVEEMWARNEKPHYEGDPSREEQLELRREERRKTAKRMRKTSQTQARILRVVLEEEWREVPALRLVLLGRKDSGKSMAGNRILSRELFGPSLMKKEFQNQRRTMVSVKHQRNVSGLDVSVVETPGWLSDEGTPDWLKEEVLHGVSMCAPGPHAFLLVVPISKGFTESDLNAVVELLEPLGEKVWRYCMVLFTWGDWLSDMIVEEYIAAEGKNLRQLMERCGNRYHVFSRYHYAFNLKLFQKINMMFTSNKGHCFTNEGNQVKKQKPSLFRRGKHPGLTEEEWNRREQELIDRMLRAVTQELEEPPVPPLKMAGSLDIGYIPSLGGDAPSEIGSTFWAHRNRARVCDWLHFPAGNSDATSGLGSMSTLVSCVEGWDENRPMGFNQRGCFSPKNDKRKLGCFPHGASLADTVGGHRRHSF